MNSCDHKPQFKIKTMFARKPQYICRNCGEKIEMTKTYRNISRGLNGVLVALLFLVAMNSGKGNVAGSINWNQMMIDFGTMIGIAALYLLLQILLFRFAKYQLAPVPEVQAPVEEAKAEDGQKPQYTPEQLEIMEMYAAAERQALIDAGQDPETVQVIEKIEEPVVDTCVHKPTKNWKNYIPTKFDFTCDNCGKPISFPPAIKKNVNMLLLVVTFLILMPNFMNAKVAFWQFGLLTLLVLVIGIAIQFFFVKRGRFILKDPNERKR